MKSLSHLNHTVLSCVQPKTLDRFFEIRQNEEVVATLAFESKFGTLATAITADGTWTFKRVGFLNPHITVRCSAKEEDLAVYEPRLLGGGVLSFPHGLTMKWKSTGFWGNSWSFVLSDENVLVGFKSGLEHGKLADIFKTQATIDINPIPYVKKYLTMLAALGMYLILMEHEESASVATMTSSAVS
jgi:hypothetical protein